MSPTPAAESPRERADDERRGHLMTVLDRARDRGFLGPGPVESHLDHALAVTDLVRRWVPGVLVDLGTGGGVPALVVLATLPRWRGVLVERSGTRARHLRWAIGVLALADRAEVAEVDAIAPPEPWRSGRGTADLVTARGFGPPTDTARAATAWLRPGGTAVVSGEPSLNRERWDVDELAALNLDVERLIRHRRTNWVVLRRS